MSAFFNGNQLAWHSFFLKGFMENYRLVVGYEGIICVAAFVAPQASNREQAKELVGADRFVVVHCSAPLGHCRAEDPTYLIKKSKISRRYGLLNRLATP